MQNVLMRDFYQPENEIMQHCTCYVWLLGKKCHLEEVTPQVGSDMTEVHIMTWSETLKQVMTS